MIKVRSSIRQDIPWLAQTMRPEDRDEVYAGSKDTPHKALIKGFTYSTECFTVACPEGKPLAMFGYVAAPQDNVSYVWMLGSTELLKHRWSFLRQSREWVDYLQSKAPILTNLVDRRNTVHIAWLKWLGFKFVRVLPEYGHLKLPFVEFVRTKSCAE
jgi:hypothetical protein